ncbi:MAG: methyltransferase [Chloroflexaceae bacterium]|nr:methyltransferase [Chloroflexaceae bacterium]NJO07086.1 methyltransferase [Chloroflexaceae bacterium]
MQHDIYFKKRISYTAPVQAEHFFFDVGHTIFSSFQIDEGTDLLLRLVEPPPDAALQHILDLGCGCGVLGIVLARRFPMAQVTMADKDLLAVRYARANTELNNTPNTSVLGSVGLEQVPTHPYDLIVSNIPAKIGDDAIEQEFMLAPIERLRPGGVFWFVVVSGLNRLIPKIGVRHQLNLKEIKKRAGHTVYRFQKPAHT